MKKNLIIAFLMVSLLTIAQEKDSINALSEVTIIGNKANSITGSGQHIGNHKLQKLNQSNINNVLRLVPGVNIRDEEGFGLRPNIGLRGTPVNRSAKITLMEDGILIAPAPYADPSAYYFPTFARMQGIEVLKGSSQIKYGPYTIGGAVNLLSTAIPTSFKGFAEVSYGSFGTNLEKIGVGDSRKNFDYLFEVTRLAGNGFKELDGGGNTGFDRRDMMGKLRWHTDNDAKTPQSVSFKFVSTTEDGNESYLGLTYEDFKNNPVRRYAATQKDHLDMNHLLLSLNYTILPVKNLTISTTAYYTKTFRDWARVNSVGGQSVTTILNDPTKYQTAYQIMVGNANGNIDYQSAARTYFTKGIQSNIHYLLTTGEINHNIQLGIRYHEDQADRYATKSVYTMTGGTMVLTTGGVEGNQENQIRNANSLAAFLSYDIIYKGLKVSPGIRYESINFDFQNYGNADNARLGTNLKTADNHLSIVLPGMGINYEINKNMNVFGGIHKGFSPPGMPSVTSTEQAKAETALSYELGYRFHKKGIHATVVGFLNQYDNILGSDNLSGGGAGTGEMFNAGKAKIQGVELSFGMDVLYKENKTSDWKLPIYMTYTYTDAKFQETFQNGGGDWGSGIIYEGDVIPFITPNQWTASIGIENHKFNATLLGRYIGETRTKPGQEAIILPDYGVKYNDVNAIGSYFILDLSGNYKLTKIFTLFSTLNNILNNKNIISNLPQGYRPAMPFNINFGIKAQW